MRGLVIGAAVLAMAGLAQAATYPPAIAKLIATEEHWNDLCRGGSDGPVTDNACVRRDQLVLEIKAAGYCWGQTAYDEAVSSFERCITSPSFDCSKATSFAEHAICSDSDLMADDRKVAALYTKALAEKGAGARDEQRKALRARKLCATAECVRDWYARREADLLTSP